MRAAAASRKRKADDVVTSRAASSFIGAGVNNEGSNGASTPSFTEGSAVLTAGEAELDAAVSALSSTFPFSTSAMSNPSTSFPPYSTLGSVSNLSNAPPSLKKRSQLSAREKLRVVEWYHANGKNQQATAAHFKALPGFEKLSQSTVSRYIAGELRIRELVDSGRASVVRVNPVRNPDFENILVAWLDRHDAARVTGELIKQTAARVYDHLRTPPGKRLELSNGWLRSFQVRHGMKGAKTRRSVGDSTLNSETVAATTASSIQDESRSLHSMESDNNDGSRPRTEPLPLSGRYTALPLLEPDTDHLQYANMYAVPSMMTVSSESTTPVPPRRSEPAGTPHEPLPLHQQQPLSQHAVVPAADRAPSPQLPGPLRRSPTSSIPDSMVKREQERIAASIRDFLSWDHRRSLRDVWNLDELALAYAYSPRQCESDSARTPTLTLALATNVDGSERKDPVIIGKAARPSSFKRGRAGDELGFQYLHNRGAWMTADIFAAWLETWNAELLAHERHVLLLVDSYSGHRLGKQAFSNVQLEYFNARVTEIVQPFCDAVGGIARAFKACYRRLAVLRAADRLMSAIDFADRERAFEIDQLAAMELVVRAWPLVQSETITKCWRNARILPMDQSSSRTDVRPAKLALPELQTLQNALFFLIKEARVKEVALNVVDAAAFVDVGSEVAGNEDARLEELVQFTVGGSSGDAAMGGDDSDRGSPNLNPVQVYRSLLTLEQFWREKPARLPDEVLKLMQLTRVQLQAEIIRGREEQSGSATRARRK